MEKKTVKETIERYSKARRAIMETMDYLRPFVGKNFNRLSEANQKMLQDRAVADRDKYTELWDISVHELHAPFLKDWPTITIDHMEQQVKDIEEAIHAMDLFDTYAEEMEGIRNDMRELIERRNNIVIKCGANKLPPQFRF